MRHRPDIIRFPSHVLVNRRTRDPKLPREERLSLTGFNSASQIIGLGCGQAPDSAEVDIPLLRQRDSLALALSDQVTLELSHGTDYAQEQMRHRGVFPGEGQVFFHKPDVHSTLYKIEYEPTQIVEIAGQPVHGVTHDRVAFTHEAQHGGELWTIRIFAGSLVASRYEAEPDDLPGGAALGMTDRQIRDEVLTIFLAGYETVANALTWTWYLLSQNPEVEARLHRELDAVLGTGPDRKLPNLESYGALRYTEQVFAEAMRLFPPAWAMGRKSTEVVTLGEYIIPPGAHFFFSQYVMHRTPEYFPDPLRFDPDRFSPEQKAEREKFTYFPFGGGGRQCIGESFAWMEGVLVLATIAQRWRLRFTGDEPPVPQAKITLRPRGVVRMRLEAREP